MDDIDNPPVGKLGPFGISRGVGCINAVGKLPLRYGKMRIVLVFTGKQPVNIQNCCSVRPIRPIDGPAAGNQKRSAAVFPDIINPAFWVFRVNGG